MHFDSLGDFLNMGGYGGFVWPSYGLTILVLGWLLLASILRHRRLVAQLGRLERRRHGRKRK